MKKVNIYGLVDPITLEIRYVGKTVSTIKERLRIHIHQSKVAVKHTHKEAWIKGLLLKNIRPTIKLIEEVDHSVWAEREMYWISKIKNLTNTTLGGDVGNTTKCSEKRKEYLRVFSKNIKGFYNSGLGRKWTEEQKEKRRLKPPHNKGVKGIYKTSETTKNKMSKSHKGKSHAGYKWSEAAKEKFKSSHKKGVETRKKRREGTCAL